MKYFVVAVFLCLSVLSVSSVSNPKGHANVNDPAVVEFFSHLPDSIIARVLSTFSVRELFEFSLSNNYVSKRELAAEAYGAVYGDVKVIVKDLRKQTADEILAIRNEALQLGNTDTLIIFLKTFNRHIKHLRINVAHLTKGERQTILDAIAEHCAETITKFEIRQAFGNDFDEITKISFPNVEELTIVSSAHFVGRFSLNSAFPSVRKLACANNRIEDETWIVDNFSNLTHLQVHLQEFMTEKSLVKTLKKNPTITSLSIIEATPSIIRIVNEGFPNIVNLGIVRPFLQSFGFDEEPVHMDHVERFLFEDGKYLSNFITFKNLKELQWHQGAYSDALVDFVKQYKNQIEKMVIDSKTISNEHLTQINGMEKLQTVTFTFEANMYGFPEEKNPSFTAGGLWKFLIANPALKVIRLVNPSEEIKDALQSSLKSTGFGEREREREREFNLHEEKNGDVFLFKGCMQSNEWNNDMKFLRANFF